MRLAMREKMVMPIMGRSKMRMKRRIATSRTVRRVVKKKLRRGRGRKTG